MKKEKEPDLCKQLEEEYARWNYIRENGSSDPFWDDATNMNLVRNHIIYTREQMKEKYGAAEARYPPEFFREIPPEVETGYIVRAAEIREQAYLALESYLSDPNFQFLLINQKYLNKKEAAKISLYNVMGYASSLAHALKTDDLITMRRHASRPESYGEAFAGCAEKVKQILRDRSPDGKGAEKNVQMSLDEVGMDTGSSKL